MEEEEGVIEQQYYSLRWRGHSSNLTSRLQQYLEQGILTDVTLACDGEKFKAHQLVLSASSPYFENMFVSHPCPHPLIFIMGVKASEIRAILEFLYTKTVTVSQSCLQDFLKAAETLQIRGLVSDESEYEDTDKMEHQNESEKISECRHNDSHVSNGETENTGEDKQQHGSNQKPMSSPLNSYFSKLKSGEISYFNSPSKAGSSIKTSENGGREIKNKRKYAKTGSSNANSMNNSMEVDSDSTNDECYNVGYYLDVVSLPEKPEDDHDFEQEDGSSNEIPDLDDDLEGGSLFESVEGTPHLKRCKLCGKLVRGRKHRFVHMPGSYTCPYCSCVYTRRDNLNAHMKSKHGNSSLKLPLTPTSGGGILNSPAGISNSYPNSPNSIEYQHDTKTFFTDCIWPISSVASQSTAAK